MLALEIPLATWCSGVSLAAFTLWSPVRPSPRSRLPVHFRDYFSSFALPLLSSLLGFSSQQVQLQWVLGQPSVVRSARYSEEQCTSSINKTHLSWEPIVVGLGHAPLLNWSHVCQHSLVQDLQIQGNDPRYLCIVITCLQCKIQMSQYSRQLNKLRNSFWGRVHSILKGPLYNSHGIPAASNFWPVFLHVQSRWHHYLELSETLWSMSASQQST